MGTVCSWAANTARGVPILPARKVLKGSMRKSTSTPRYHPTGATIAGPHAQRTPSPGGRQPEKRMGRPWGCWENPSCGLASTPTERPPVLQLFSATPGAEPCRGSRA